MLCVWVYAVANKAEVTHKMAKFSIFNDIPNTYFVMLKAPFSCGFW